MIKKALTQVFNYTIITGLLGTAGVSIYSCPTTASWISQRFLAPSQLEQKIITSNTQSPTSPAHTSTSSNTGYVSQPSTEYQKPGVP